MIITLIFDRAIDFVGFEGVIIVGFYRTKIIDYDYKERISVYSGVIAYDSDSYSYEGTGTKHRQCYKRMSEERQKRSDDRRVRYYKKKVHDLIEIALMNPKLNVVITLTFKESVTSYDLALGEWQLFLKRLRHHYNDLQYICVWEYQRNRSTKAGIDKGGVFHFHALMNTGYIEHSELEKIWGNGFVWIDSLGSEAQREKAIKYTMKYCVKELTRRIEAQEDIRGQRFFFTSNNLRKPKETVINERLNLDDIIVEHLENMIKDGGYDIKDESGKTINHVEYIEYRKERE